MKKFLSWFFLISALAVFSTESFSQNKYENGKVANYSTGKYNSSIYEHFSFWVDQAGKPLEISYSMKNRDKDIAFSYEGKTADGKGFKIKAPNGATSSVYIVGNNLRIISDKNKRAKIFRWEYEGPINGIGTFCTPCAEEPKDAAKLLRNSYL